MEQPASWVDKSNIFMLLNSETAAVEVTQAPQGLNPTSATPETSESVTTSSRGSHFPFALECFWSISVQHKGMFPIQNIYNKHPSGKSKEQNSCRRHGNYENKQILGARSKGCRGEANIPKQQGKRHY